jgi:uncharacterized protein RhaS with RHS repeats
MQCIYIAKGTIPSIVAFWQSRDPIGEYGGINLYGYVGNNPVRWIDSKGEGPEVIVIGLGLIGLGLYEAAQYGKDLIKTADQAGQQRKKEYDNAAEGKSCPAHAYGDSANNAMPKIKNDVNGIAGSMPGTSLKGPPDTPTKPEDLIPTAVGMGEEKLNEQK